MKPKTLLVWGLLGLTSLAVAGLLAYLSRWQTALVGIIPLVGGLAGCVLVLMTLLAWSLAKIRQAAGLRRTSKFLLVAGFFLLLQLAYIPITQTLRRMEVAQAQVFVQALIPRLEAYKAQQGVYPGTIEAILTDDITSPALLQLQGDFPLPFNNRNFYFQRGPTYGFRFYLPDGFIGYSYEYCCGPQGRWTVTD
jgi:hypothetical protein